MKAKELTSLVLVTLCGFAQVADAEPSRGAVLTAACAQCHGTNAGAGKGFESLLGESAAEMYDELLEQKYDQPEGIMNLQARGYTDEQLWLISEYLATVQNKRSRR